jgi:DNA-binding NarL/FixJ family response regulator
MSLSGRTQIRVLVVDDQDAFRRVALDVIEATPGFEPVGAAASGEEALELVGEVSPELVLMDVRMPVMDGLETTRRLSAAHPETVIVLISIDDPAELPRAVGSCGATTLIRKQDFGPLALRRIWAAHGRGDLRSAFTPR